MNKHVAVLMGGWSAERPVSLNSGAACAAALRERGYRVSEVDVGRDLGNALSALKPDIAFNALHGPFGEDGTVQGLLEIMGLPYTHSGVLASSLAMRKDRAKVVMAAAGVPVAQGRTLSRFEIAKAHPMLDAYVAKPVADGSSFGVYIVHETRNAPLFELAREDWPLGDTMLVEEFIPGLELTCGVMGFREGAQALDIIEIQPATGEFYDFDAKYAKGGSIHVLPAKLKPNLYQLIQEMAVRAHEALGCRGVSRADFRYDPTTERLVCLEVNTQPGMTATSLVPELAAQKGLSFGELVEWMVEDASLER
jgi:D-alanine-D-alanine ligase